MKKLLVSIAFIGLSAFYVFSRPSDTAATEPVSLIVTPTPKPTPAPTPKPVPAPVPTPTPTPAKTGYKDGVYTGSVADAYYGLVQVRATIKNGLITDVAFLSYPNDRDTSRYINGQAMPMLTQEAIAAQSANVDIISGATDTSLAFRESLAVALSSAKY